MFFIQLLYNHHKERETSSTTPPQPAAISSLEYGYRRTTAWDLKAYAELCDADIGDIFVKVANVPSKRKKHNLLDKI